MPDNSANIYAGIGVALNTVGDLMKESPDSRFKAAGVELSAIGLLMDAEGSAWEGALNNGHTPGGLCQSKCTTW